MFKHNRTKLHLERDTIRQLSAAQLTPVAGAGGSDAHTCSLCPGLAGCDTGPACAAGPPR